MNKKFIAVLAMLLGLGTASTFAVTGIGLQSGYELGAGVPLAVTFKVQQLPCVFAVNAGFGSGYFSVGGTADWWAANPKINVKGANGKWRWYYAFGAAAGVQIWSGNGYSGASVLLGPRAVIGTNYFINGSWEVYGQAAYQPTFYIGLGEGTYSGASWFYVPVNVGFRYWF